MTTTAAKPERVYSKINIEGVWVPLGNKEYLMPALNLRGMQVHKATLQIMQSGRQFDQEMSDDYINSVCAIFHAALVRNYPDLTPDDVLDGADLRNFGKITFAVMGLSGFTVPAEGTAPAGEATDASGAPLIQAGESTGTA